MDAVFWGSDIRARIEKLVENAVPNTAVWLISPYTKTEVEKERTDLLSRSISEALANKVNVHMVIRAGTTVPAGLRALAKKGLRLYEMDSLHAKLYLSEQQAIVTSLNLYAPTSDSTLDLGVAVAGPSETHSQLKGFIEKKILSSVRPIDVASLPPLPVMAEKTATVKAPAAVSASAPQEKPPAKRRGKKPAAVEKPGFFGRMLEAVFNPSGTCIRCGTDVDYDPDKPLCGECFNSWVRFANPDYREKFCHDCGSETRASMRKPLCADCYEASA